MSDRIIGKRLTIILKNGIRRDYTHITSFWTDLHSINIFGETDSPDGMRINTQDFYLLNNTHLVIFEPLYS